MTDDNKTTKNDAAKKQLPPEEQQAVDKAPGEEVGKGEKVTNEDLKGKTVDRRIDEDEE